MLKTFDLGNTENVVYNGKEVLILKLKDKTQETVLFDLTAVPDDEQFNYTALDANYKMEGQVAYDGTAVAYAIGKPTIQYYQQVIPTPATREEYNGKYGIGGEYNGETIFVQITSTNEDIIPGETVCYELSSIKENAVGDKSSYAFCNGYNSEFYNGYDFTTKVTEDSQYIVPEELVIPATYKGLPVVKILECAFYGSTQTSNSFEGYQAYNIKCINFPNNSNIEVLNPRSLYGLSQVNVDVVLPASLKEIDGFTFVNLGTHKVAEQRISITIPENVENIRQAVLQDWNGIKVIYKSKNAVCDTNTFNSSTRTNLIFEESVESISGQILTDKVPTTWVFKHTQDAEIGLNFTTSIKTATAITIYTDNIPVQLFDWAGKNLTPTFKPLSEYTG